MKREEEKLPEKVELMYEAVISMLAENADINNMKVIDITKRAGIGKGTAYEYFSSKEEIITKALMFDTKRQFNRVFEIIGESDGFQQKVYGVLDWILDNFHECKTFAQLVRIGMGTYDVSKNLQEEMVKIHTQECGCPYMEEMVDQIMQCGVEEGIIMSHKKELLRMAFGSQILMFAMYLSDKQNIVSTEIGKEEVREFCYESIVKALN